MEDGVTNPQIRGSLPHVNVYIGRSGIWVYPGGSGRVDHGCLSGWCARVQLFPSLCLTSRYRNKKISSKFGKKASGKNIL